MLFPMGARIVLLVIVLLGAVSAHSQGGEARFNSVLANRRVRVYSLVLQPRMRASLFQNTHHLLWIALNDAHPTLIAEDGPDILLPLDAGEVRLLQPFRAKAVVNHSGEAVRAVVVELTERGTNPLCDCVTAVARVVCGCPAAEHLPALWAYAVGNLMLAGTTLPPGEGFKRASERGDMLLVAISPVLLEDEAADPAARTIKLDPGQAAWIEHGRHQFRNLSGNAARFVTVEF